MSYPNCNYKYFNRHSKLSIAARVLWRIAWIILFRPSPRHFHVWRIFLLRAFGAKIASDCAILPSCRIWAPWNLEMMTRSTLAEDVDCYCVAMITLGENVTVSQGAFLCAASHDIRSATMELLSAPIKLEKSVWVAARAIILPGVTIGEGSVVGAGSVVSRDVPSWTVMAGNPAKLVGTRHIDRK